MFLLLVYRDAQQSQSLDDRAQEAVEYSLFESDLRASSANALADTVTAYTGRLVDVIPELTGYDAKYYQIRADKEAEFDGAFPETPKTLRRLYILNVSDFSAAKGWAVRCPGAKYGSIEVRFMDSMADTYPIELPGDVRMGK